MALGWIPTRSAFLEEDAGGNAYEEVVWYFRTRLGQAPRDATLDTWFQSLTGLLSYYKHRINNEFDAKFNVQGEILNCPRCQTSNRRTTKGDYRCTFCGMKYNK